MRKLTDRQRLDAKFKVLYASQVPGRLAAGPLHIFQTLSEGFFSLQVLGATEVEGEIRMRMENGLTMGVKPTDTFMEDVSVG